MKKTILYIITSLLVPMGLMAQEEYGRIERVRNPYLSQAPYDGLHGQIDSVRIIAYQIKESINSNDFLRAKDENEKIKLFIGAVNETSTTRYDKHGYFTYRLDTKANEDGEQEVSSHWEVTRDQNSLPTHIIFHTPSDDNITDLVLHKRENGVETYRTHRPRRVLPSIPTLVEQQVVFEGDTTTTLISYPSGYKTSYTYVYNENGHNIYWTDKMDGEDTYTEVVLEYNEQELLVQRENKDYEIVKGKAKLKKNTKTFFNYILFEYDSNTHIPNWLKRVLVDEKGNTLGIEEQELFYSK